MLTIADITWFRKNTFCKCKWKIKVLSFFLSLVSLSVAIVNDSVKVFDGEPSSESKKADQKGLCDSFFKRRVCHCTA